MVEVQGKSVRLYLEGLMFFSLNEKQKRLEAGILNIDDGHSLKVRSYSRRSTNSAPCSEEVWQEGEAEFISDMDIQLYERGEVTILGPGGDSKNISSPRVPRNRELWMPFKLIPDIEEIVGSKVKLDKSKVKPVLSITGGNYFSVLRPEHLENETLDCGFIQTYRLAKDQVVMGKIESNESIQSLDELIDLGVVAKDLGVRAYTAATMISLCEGQELVCVLKSDQAEDRLLFKVRYSPDYEAKVAIENIVTEHGDGSEMHSHHEEGESDPTEIFHFLHFYDAIKVSKVKEKYFLASEEMVLTFVNEIQDRTGADNPLCPAVIKSGGLFT